MRRLVLTAAALAAIAGLGTLTNMRAAKAEVQYPWCAQYQPPLDAVNCGFTSFQQCLATVRGIGGYCYRNPAYPQPRRHR